jgi:hypothetical protein
MGRVNGRVTGQMTRRVEHPVHELPEARRMCRRVGGSAHDAPVDPVGGWGVPGESVFVGYTPAS